MIQYTPKYLKQKALREARKAAGLPAMTEETKAKNAARYQKKKSEGLISFKGRPKTEAQKNWKPSGEKGLALARIRKDKANQKDREKRRLARESGVPDKRKKENRVKEHYKTALAAPKPAPKETRLPQSPKVTLLRKERKPRAQDPVCKIPTQDPTTTKTWIPELKMHVFLRPGQSVADVVDKYTQRPGAKIGKW